MKLNCVFTLDRTKKFILCNFEFYQLSKLPKNFPEYSIMYKTLNKKILDLTIEKNRALDESTVSEIQSDIEKYQKEISKIKTIFPEGFFEKIG